MRMLSQETLTEELMNCYNNAGYTVGVLCSSLRRANNMASQFYSMLDRIDGAEVIECDTDPVRCRTDYRIVFRNCSELKIITPSSRERNAGERFDRILYEEDTAYRDRLEYMALECGPARYDDVIGTVEANREEMCITYDDNIDNDAFDKFMQKLENGEELV